MMGELTRIVDQISRAFNGEAWHGKPLMTVLAEVPAERAIAPPALGPHRIGTLAGHILAWQRVVLRRLAGEVVEDLPPEENWPTISTKCEWEGLQQELSATHAELIAAIRQLSESQLDRPVPGKDYSVYVMLHGLIQHTLYHTGQIALLNKC